VEEPDRPAASSRPLPPQDQQGGREITESRDGGSGLNCNCNCNCNCDCDCVSGKPTDAS